MPKYSLKSNIMTLILAHPPHPTLPSCQPHNTMHHVNCAAHPVGRTTLMSVAPCMTWTIGSMSSTKFYFVLAFSWVKKYFLPKAVGSGFVIIRSSNNVVLHLCLSLRFMIPTNMHLEKLPFIWMWIYMNLQETGEDHIENGEDENYEGVSVESSKY